VKGWRAALGEEPFDTIELGVQKRLEQSNAERLSDERCRTVEHCIDAGDLCPFSATFRLKLATSVNSGSVRHGFRALESPRQREIDRQPQRSFDACSPDGVNTSTATLKVRCSSGFNAPTLTTCREISLPSAPWMESTIEYSQGSPAAGCLIVPSTRSGEKLGGGLRVRCESNLRL
jgi:hypothetical protein